MQVRRIDAGGLSKPVRQPNGWLRVDGYLTRTGVFLYGMPDGSTRREYRPPDEVFKADTLASFELVPVTDAHPPEFLNAENTTKYQRGAVSAPKVAGKKVAGTLLVTDAELVRKMEDGDARQVSCGYLCDLEDAAGVTPEGERYDAIQRNIRGNHVAIVPVGRAGPEVAVRMDAAMSQPAKSCEACDAKKCDVDGCECDCHGRTDSSPPPKEHHMAQLRIDGITYEVPTEAVVQAFTKFEQTAAAVLAQAKKDAAEAQAKVDAAQAKADTAAEGLAKAQAELKELPARVRADMVARAKLETKARAVLGADAKLDGLSDADVRVAVLAKLVPNWKADGKSASYIEARFDAETERADADDSDWKADADKLEKSSKSDSNEGEHVDADAARAAYLKASQGAWKKPLTASK
jgi:uncharacterized protein